jgi:hypothetical protein
LYISFVDILGEYNTWQDNKTLEEAYEEFTEEFLAQQEEHKALAEECSMFSQKKLPPKQVDPRRFTIHCSIGGKKVEKTLCDLSSRINVMWYHFYERSNTSFFWQYRRKCIEQDQIKEIR